MLASNPEISPIYHHTFRIDPHKLAAARALDVTLTVDTSNLDMSFDSQLSSSGALTWLPWVGCEFRSSPHKLMILGESVYNWAPEKRGVTERLRRDDHVRLIHQNHALNTSRNSRYVRNIERALFNSRNPRAHDVNRLWRSVAYHNLVLRPMPTLKDRPTHADYADGWREALRVISVLGIEKCLAYGLESRKIQALHRVTDDLGIPCARKDLSPIAGYVPVSFTINQAGHSTDVLMIRHPSAFFSWKKWGALLKEKQANPVGR